MSPRFSAGREVAVGLGSYAVYLLCRWAVVNDRGRRAALWNARRIVAVEERLGVHVEPHLQRAALPHTRALAIANVGYVTLNVVITVGWLALHEGFHPGARERLVIGSLIAVLVLLIATANFVNLSVALAGRRGRVRCDRACLPRPPSIRFACKASSIRA